VGDADGGIGGVDVLPARTAGAVGIDFQIARINRDINLVRLWQHRDSRRAGVDAPAAFGHGDALHPVHAAFKLQLGEHPGAGDVGDHFLEAPDFRGVDADRLDFPALLVGVFFIHPVEVGGEQRGLIAPRPGADFQHRGLGIGGIARQQFDGEPAFEIWECRLERG